MKMENVYVDRIEIESLCMMLSRSFPLHFFRSVYQTAEIITSNDKKEKFMIWIFIKIKYITRELESECISVYIRKRIEKK